MTKLRVAVIAVMSAGLGGVASAGLKLLDSLSSVVALVGGSAVLGVALVLDAVRMARSIRDVATDVSALGKDVAGLHDRLDDIEAKMPRASSAGRTGSFPAI